MSQVSPKAAEETSLMEDTENDVKAEPELQNQKEGGEKKSKPKPLFRRRFNRPRNQRYGDAYGNYVGGYGPGGGYGNFGFNNGPMGPPPCGPFGPPPPASNMWGRGFGPQGPPPPRYRMNDHPAMKYLKKCGVPKENLRNMPMQVLDLVEPQFCGICAVGFESFAMSRMHYISKNHQKNQKKWLNQQNEGFHYGKELPLKARDLYCELCDVHITSKDHADSHYSGKPHRAIVEGRKKPKNAMLLQPGMQNRVDQLIRREKKNLKPITEGETDAEAKVKEAKNMPPELYCNICKTSVTCSEQMTIHLNGKRHLQREKNHILKVMKGEVDPNPAAGGDANQTGKDDPEMEQDEAAEEEEVAEEKNDEDDGNDWGNGGGDDDW